MLDLKKIHIGRLIKARHQELNIPIDRICKFFKLTEEEILNMFKQKNMNSDDMLKWSKLLKYDFFRFYSQHLILYAPQVKNSKNGNIALPQFRKNIYTKDIINFILEEINTGEKTRKEAVEYYGIPKTTLYKWISKYNADENSENPD
ncbi:transposase [Chryseobacterium soli]|uniref:transposase n=1 Tax=Chryseobacterium soli TaxID=445961 RepID=UPI002954E7F7|nr:transposase [Chryseobacterium soli]MDV7698930.1 transposase [Chryseobacterium soli]